MKSFAGLKEGKFSVVEVFRNLWSRRSFKCLVVLNNKAKIAVLKSSPNKGLLFRQLVILRQSKNVFARDNVKLSVAV